jgi:hypothetical protein
VVTRTTLYFLVFVTGLAAYAWVGWNVLSESHNGFTLCLFKNMTGFPCPSCGTTRAILLLLQGEPIQSIAMNPLGIPSALLMIVFPCWIASDVVKRKNSFYNTFLYLEEWLRKKEIAYPALLLLAMIWSWEIYNH